MWPFRILNVNITTSSYFDAVGILSLIFKLWNGYITTSSYLDAVDILSLNKYDLQWEHYNFMILRCGWYTIAEQLNRMYTCLAMFVVLYYHRIALYCIWSWDYNSKYLNRTPLLNSVDVYDVTIAVWINIVKSLHDGLKRYFFLKNINLCWYVYYNKVIVPRVYDRHKASHQKNTVTDMGMHRKSTLSYKLQGEEQHI